MKRSENVVRIMLLLALFWSVARAAQSSPANGIKLKQHCNSVGGDYTVQLNSKMVRIENRSLVIFAQAPNWDMTVLNLQKKLCYRSDYKNCLKMLAATKAPFNLVADLRAQKWRQVGSELIAGLSAEKWVGYAPGGGHSSKNANAYWTSSGIELAPQCAEIIATCYGLPPRGHGVPLRFVYWGSSDSLLPIAGRQFDSDNASEKEYRWLETASSEKAQLSNALVTVPKEYKATKNFTDIAIEGSAKSSIDAQFILKDLQKHPEALFNSR